MTTPVKRRRLGELLIEAGVLDPTQLQAALAEQEKWGGKLGRTLVEMRFVDENSMVRALSLQLKLPVVDLDTVRLPATVTQLLTVDLCERYGVFPLGSDARGKTLQLATSDPTGLDAQNDITVKTGLKVQPAVATASSIERAVRRMYYGEQARPSSIATPQGFGVLEPTYDEQEFSGELSAVKLPPSRPAPVDPVAEIEAAAREAELTRLHDRVATLEKQSMGQLQALRSLVELLAESGLISREEYVAKTKKGPG